LAWRSDSRSFLRKAAISGGGIDGRNVGDLLLGIKENKPMNTTISHVILRKDVVKQDWKIKVKEKNNGRKVLVNEIFPKTQKHIENPEWGFAPQEDRTPVLETGYGGVEIATFTEQASQDRHKHLVSMDIYTVLEGTMTIRIGDKDDVVLQSGDEIIVLPGVIHEVLDAKTSFLTRVHATNCYGPRDKYTEENGAWCQAFTLKNQRP
jgi:quercetin dioxygenase-like cupin family protein